MFIIRPDEIASTLTYDACIGVMKEAMMRLSAGDSEQMLRQILPLDGGRMFGVMAGTMGPGAAFGSKLICVHCRSRDHHRDPHSQYQRYGN